MKLIVQIPCLNEEATIGQTIADIPRTIAGIDRVEVLVINDGSSDRTVEVAREAGADHVISFAQNRGFAAGWSAGIDEALRQGADIIVTTDGDNQYQGSSIPDLVRPIVAGAADMVIGARPIEQIEDFSWTKKRLQRLGSWVVRKVSATEISDAPCGFRAYSRATALRLCVMSRFSHSQETLIQAGRSGIAIAEVPIRTNRKTRESRLFRSIPQYILRSMNTIVRTYAVYEPLTFFSAIAAVLAVVGLALAVRYLYFMAIGQGGGHIQSVIVAALLLMLAGQAFALGVIADLVAANRKLLQDTRTRVRELQFGRKSDDDAGGAGTDSPQ